MSTRIPFGIPEIRSDLCSDPILSPGQRTWIENRMLQVQGLGTWTETTTNDFLQAFPEAASRVLAARIYHGTLCTLGPAEVREVQHERSARVSAANAPASEIREGKRRRGAVINPGPQRQVKVDVAPLEHAAQTCVREKMPPDAKGNPKEAQGPGEARRPRLPSDASGWSEWVVIPLVGPEELTERKGWEQVERLR